MLMLRIGGMGSFGIGCRGVVFWGYVVWKRAAGRAWGGFIGWDAKWFTTMEFTAIEIDGMGNWKVTRFEMQIWG